MRNQSSSPTSASACTVLLIEDDPEQLTYWSSVLRNCPAHYSVLEAASGQEGLELLRRQTPDCVVLDLDLSDSSGFSVLFDLVPERNRPQIAVVILTRLNYPSLAEMALHSGAHAYLMKQNTSAEALDEAIQKAMASVATSLGKKPKVCS